MIVQEATVTSLGLDRERVDVLWKFVDPKVSLAHEVWVLRSNALGGPYGAVAKTYAATSYTDWEASFSLHNRPYYRLKVVRRDTKEQVQLTDPITHGAKVNIFAREIRRRHNLVFREFTGNPTLYYPLRTEGEACPDCWSELRGQRTQSSCTTCFDTGRILGYYNPLLLWINIHEDERTLVQNVEVDEAVVIGASCLLPGELWLHEGDLVVERHGDRWLLNRFNQTELLRAPVSWRARLHKLPEKDVRHRIPLPSTDVFDKLTESREFKRQYTLNP